MPSKVILLKYMARFCDAANLGLYLQLGLHCDKTAIILKRTSDNFLSIQGYPEVPFSEKHKAWVIFQKAVKQLLGIPKDTAICIRFTDAPYSTVGSMSTLLTEPRHLIDLVVHPLQYFSNSSMTIADQEVHDSIAVSVKVPCSAFRGEHANFSTNGKQHREIRPASDDWSSLYSQLSEISVYLERTQIECDLIAEKCKDANTSSAHTYKENGRVHKGTIKKRVDHSFSFDSSGRDYREDSRVHRGIAEKGVGHYVSFNSTSSDSESGKGSMLESYTANEEKEVDIATNQMPVQDPSRVKVVRTEKEEDARVEHLLGIAQGLAQFNIRRVMQDSSSLSVSCARTSHCDSRQRQLPDAPEDVIVRASFRHGGAYVMWNPVSIDGEGFNKGHKVLGYEVYLDEKLHCTVEGALTSQAEILGMEDGTEYAIQICTRSEECNSHKIAPIIHRHHETNRVLAPKSPPTQALKLSPVSSVRANLSQTNVAKPPSAPTLSFPLLPPAHVSDLKVAKVQTWLKNKSLSNLGELQSDRSGDRLDQTVDGSSLHVHFEDDRFDSYADDVKSISSSHTSGIVTDYLVSPKLVSSCLCHHCCSDKPIIIPCHKSTPPGIPSLVHQRQRLHRLHSSTDDVICDNKDNKLLFRNGDQSSFVKMNDTAIDRPMFWADLGQHQSKKCSSTKVQRRNMDAGRYHSKHERRFKTKSCILLATYV